MENLTTILLIALNVVCAILNYQKENYKTTILSCLTVIFLIVILIYRLLQ